jgi:hypothetical protein
VWLTGGFTRTASKWKSIYSTGFTESHQDKARRIDANIAKLLGLLKRDG